MIRTADTAISSGSATGGYIIGAAAVGATGAFGMAVASIAKLILVDRPTAKNEERKTNISLLELKITKIMEDLKAELQIEQQKKNVQIHEQQRRQEQDLAERAEAIVRIERQHASQSYYIGEQLKALEAPGLEDNREQRQALNKIRNNCHPSDDRSVTSDATTGHDYSIALTSLRKEQKDEGRMVSEADMAHEQCSAQIEDLKNTLKQLSEREEQVLELQNALQIVNTQYQNSQSTSRQLELNRDKLETRVLN